MENQLAATDHGHLGQILTYAAGTGASTMVCIATSFREEHRQALDWLNEQAGRGIRFFGIEIEAFKIGDPPPAPHFKLAVQPNEWQKVMRDTVQGQRASGRAALYEGFWTGSWSASARRSQRGLDANLEGRGFQRPKPLPLLL